MDEIRGAILYLKYYHSKFYFKKIKSDKIYPNKSTFHSSLFSDEKGHFIK